MNTLLSFQKCFFISLYLILCSDQDQPMIHHEQEISFNDSLQEFADTVPPEMKKRKKKKKEKPPEKGSLAVRYFRV